MRNSKIRLAKNIYLDKNYNEVLDFTEQQMIDLIENRANIVYSSDTYSFIRETGRIRVNANYITCLKANYMAFQNSDYLNKWFFAFIDNVNYISNGTTEIEFSIDIFSTWNQYIQYKPVFVVREHVNDDTLGLHTKTESIEVGDFICNDHIKDARYTGMSIVWGSTRDPFTWNKVSGGLYQGVPSGIKYYKMADVNVLMQRLTEMANEGYDDSLVSLFLAPNFLVQVEDDYKIVNSWQVYSYEISIPRQLNLNGYVPKNKKCLCYPYCYTEVDSMGGSAVVLKQEKWKETNNNMVFRVLGSMTPGCSIKGFPVNYNGITNNYEESITLAKYPQLNWNTDQYNSWMAVQGSNLINGTITSTAIGAVTSFATMNPIGLINAGTNVLSALRQVNQMEFVSPSIQGNINSGDVMASADEICFRFYQKSVKYENAKTIDNYFTRMGYLVNVIKQPNVTGRRYFNYVQVANEESVCYGFNNSSTGVRPSAKDINFLNDLFRRGVTIWHNHDHFGNYAIENDIL